MTIQNIFSKIKSSNYETILIFREVERMLQSYTEHVKRYGIAELVFQGPSEGNPFAEQWVKGTMAGRGKACRGLL